MPNRPIELRDWFAAMVATYEKGIEPRHVAARAYQIADAMIEQRRKPPR